jgi:hypothetical protein
MGKAKRFNPYDAEVDSSRKIVENYGVMRQLPSGVTSSLGGNPTGRVQSNEKLALPKTGGKMVGPVAFSMNTLTISGGVLDLTSGGTGSSPVQSYALIAPQSGSTDTLDTISNRKYPGQMLILSSAIPGSTITITHQALADGQIQCPGGVDLTLEYPESVILIDDDDAGGAYETWRVIGVPKAAGATTSFIGFTADDHLDMGGYDITNIDDIKMAVGDKYFFDGGSDTYMTGSSTSGRINVFNNAVNVTSFLTSGLLTTNITCADITTTGDIDIDGNTLYLDSDRDSSIDSFVDDTIQFATSGSARMSITNSTITVTNPIAMSSNDITGITTAVFDNSGIPTSGEVGIGSTTGDMYFEVPSPDSYFFRISGTTEVEIDADGIDIRNGWLELEERTAPSGLSNHARLYAKDNGSGKTQLVVIFGSGAEQVIATEP